MTETQQGGPLEATRTFVDAVAWGEHHTVWDLLAAEGRKTVLRVAVNYGMDEDLAARLRDGTASGGELNEFLIDLVNGLRADLQDTDLDNLTYDLDTDGLEPGQARVVLTTPVPVALGPALPAGSVELSEEDGRWRVDRLIPRRSITG